MEKKTLEEVPLANEGTVIRAALQDKLDRINFHLGPVPGSG